MLLTINKPKQEIKKKETNFEKDTKNLSDDYYKNVNSILNGIIKT